MKLRIQSAFLSLILILTSLLPAQQSALAAPVLQPTTQGEIAYVLDGDIWLLDLVSGDSQQLTSDGDNRWPAWSDDGRYLLYTHALSDDEMALYLLEVDKKAKPRLLAENACCAAWEKNGEHIAYIIFMAMAAPQLLRSRRSQTTEVLRNLLTDATQAQTTLDPLFEQAFATTPATIEKALDALGATIENVTAYNAALIGLRPDLAAAYAGLGDSAQGNKLQLQLLRLTAQLIFLNQ